MTISDIARLAQVSKKSVSRVLNGEVGVSDATRARIVSIMNEHGYAPDRRARALAGNRSYLLGLAYNNRNPAYVLNLLQGVVQAANEQGYEIVLHPMAGAEDVLQTELESFAQRSGTDGVILTPPLSESPALISGAWPERTRFVRISGDDVSLNIPQVTYDDRSAALAITNRLIELGHERIGFVGGPKDSGPTRRRLFGFRDALASRSIAARADWQCWGDFTFKSGMECGQRLLSGKDRPTALMCCNDEMAAGVIHAIREQGLRVPDDLSVTGFDDAPIAQEVWPPLTTVRQPVLDMGAAAARTLIAWLETGRKPADIDRFTHAVVDRQSAAAPRR